MAFLGIATLATSPAILSAFIALAGAATALTRTASSVLIARNVDPGRQGVAFGLKHCSIPIGSLLAGLSVPTIALTVGWHWAYVAAAVLSAHRAHRDPAGAGRGPRRGRRKARPTCRSAR